MCGYNGMVVQCLKSLKGSSPRVRVQLAATITGVVAFRIIPACAGTTCMLQRYALFFRDHPRVCGYNVSSFTLLLTRSGSSPRVRVQLYITTCGVYSLGIIPACAGTTHFFYSCSCFLQDHPRVCGYNSKKSHNFSDSYFFDPVFQSV